MTRKHKHLRSIISIFFFLLSYFLYGFLIMITVRECEYFCVCVAFNNNRCCRVITHNKITQFTFVPIIGFNVLAHYYTIAFLPLGLDFFPLLTLFKWYLSSSSCKILPVQVGSTFFYGYYSLSLTREKENRKKGKHSQINALFAFRFW